MNSAHSANPWICPLIDCRDIRVAGGKAVNLGRLMGAGFTVPDGFAITTHAFQLVRSQLNGDLPAELIESVCRAYRGLGGGRVAVRSSATCEDMADASMAGQYETILNVEGDIALIQAVRDCWASLESPRLKSYLGQRGIDPAVVSMGVVVQTMIDARVAGVLFTANPRRGGRKQMLIEAAFGLGERLVSGQIQPDILTLDAKTGAVLHAGIAEESACQSSSDVVRLWQLGHRAVEVFGSPQDIEWAIAGDEIHLLQSRPITTLAESEAFDQCLDSTRQTLQRELAAGRGPWVIHNLSETLAHPTPLTWSVMRRFMSGDGGFGAMYRMAGFCPSAAACRDGFLELIGGKIYMDVSRAGEMFFEDFPFSYDLETLKRDPEAAQSPPTLPRGPWTRRVKIGRQVAEVNRKLLALSASFDRDLRDTYFPELNRYIAGAAELNLQTLTSTSLIDFWRDTEREILDSFGARALLPSLIASMALNQLREFVAETFWEEDVDRLTLLLSSGGEANATLLADQELYEVAQGERSMQDWLGAHGHRAAGEFDLSARRWREDEAAAQKMADRLGAGQPPIRQHHATAKTVADCMTWLESRLSKSSRRLFRERVDLVRRYIQFREDAKDYLMRGYDLLRVAAVEAGRRLGGGDGIFFLSRGEMFDALRVGYAPLNLINQRQLEYRAQARLELPRVMDGDAIELCLSAGEKTLSPALSQSTGRGEKSETPVGHSAMPVSGGRATAIVRVVRSLGETVDIRGCILVCASTDPAWTPLFVGAAGLVLERGGALSHGAVVAREMGLPAVVLPNAMRLLRDGHTIHLDGDRGWVGPPNEAGAVVVNDSRIEAQLIPPPAGAKDRTAARVRNIAAAFWIIFLAGMFGLPKQLLHDPILHLLDALLWPPVRQIGASATVATVAVMLALISLLVQKFATDNRRLVIARSRAAALTKQARTLPVASVHRIQMQRLAAGVQLRSLSAAMVAVGILLGPLMLPFVWFEARLDSAAQSPAAGSAVRIVAAVQGDWTNTVRIEAPAPMIVDEATPRQRRLPPLRATLQRLLTLYRQPPAVASEAWELSVAPDLSRTQTADDLQHYLSHPIPAQGMTWLIRTPDGYDGRFAVTVTTANNVPVSIPVVVGRHYPPSERVVSGGSGSPIQSLRVVYPPAATDASSLEFGWLTIYILAYVPALLAARYALKVG